MKRSTVVVLTAALMLAGCGGDDRAAQRAAALETESMRQAQLYETHRAAGRWELARAQAEKLLADYPNSKGARQVSVTLDDTTAKAGAAYEERRLANLWIYHQVQDEKAKGKVYTAYMYAKETGEAYETRVRLVIRRHPEWGQSVYLLRDTGEFACSTDGCEIDVRFDDAAAKRIAAYKPEANLQALFVTDDKAFLEALTGVKNIVLDAPPKERGPKTLAFEVGGFDPARLEAAIP